MLQPASQRPRFVSAPGARGQRWLPLVTSRDAVRVVDTPTAGSLSQRELDDGTVWLLNHQRNARRALIQGPKDETRATQVSEPADAGLLRIDVLTIDHGLTSLRKPTVFGGKASFLVVIGSKAKHTLPPMRREERANSARVLGQKRGASLTHQLQNDLPVILPPAASGPAAGFTPATRYAARSRNDYRT